MCGDVKTGHVGELAALEVVFARVLVSDDPWRALVSARDEPATPPEVRLKLTHVSEDGLRIAGLLVAKLRFERVMNGSHRAAEWFERDPGAFTDAFRRYHTTTPPREIFPGLEARRFEAWLEQSERL